MDSGGQIRVMHRELALGFQEEVAQFIGGIPAVPGLTADGDRFPVGIAFVESAAGRRNVKIDELGHRHPHALQQLDGFLLGEPPLVHVLLEVRIHVLVHPAVGDDGAGLLLDARKHLDKPLRLQGFVERRGRMLRNAFADPGDLGQLRFALRVFFLGGHLCGQARVTLGPNDDGVAHGDNGFQERLLFDVVHRAERVESLDALLGFLADAFEALLQHLLVVVDPLDGGPEGGGFVDDEP